MKHLESITAQDAFEYFLALGVKNGAFHSRDGVYALYPLDLLTGTLYEQFAEWLAACDLAYDSAPETADWDCEDFAQGYVLFCNIYHRQNQRFLKDHWANSTAVWECWVNELQHALCIVLYRDEEGKLCHAFIETQPKSFRRVRTLTAEQIASISLIR